MKEFLTRAVAHELGSALPVPRRTRVKLPLIVSSKPGSVDLTNDDIEAIFADEDAERTR